MQVCISYSMDSIHYIRTLNAYIFMRLHASHLLKLRSRSFSKHKIYRSLHVIMREWACSTSLIWFDDFNFSVLTPRIKVNQLISSTAISVPPFMTLPLYNHRRDYTPNYNECNNDAVTRIKPDSLQHLWEPGYRISILIPVHKPKNRVLQLTKKDQ